MENFNYACGTVTKDKGSPFSIRRYFMQPRVLSFIGIRSCYRLQLIRQLKQYKNVSFMKIRLQFLFFFFKLCLLIFEVKIILNPWNNFYLFWKKLLFKINNNKNTILIFIRESEMKNVIIIIIIIVTITSIIISYFSILFNTFLYLFSNTYRQSKFQD